MLINEFLAVSAAPPSVYFEPPKEIEMPVFGACASQFIRIWSYSDVGKMVVAPLAKLVADVTLPISHPDIISDLAPVPVSIEVMLVTIDISHPFIPNVLGFFICPNIVVHVTFEIVLSVQLDKSIVSIATQPLNIKFRVVALETLKLFV